LWEAAGDRRTLVESPSELGVDCKLPPVPFCAVESRDAVSRNLQPDRGSKHDDIVAAAIGQIEIAGYDAVALRAVAREARVSLTTIYKTFPSRDALLFAAVQTWMERNVYRHVTVPDQVSSVSDRLLHVMRSIFRPWLEHPKMVEAFVRASEVGGGAELRSQGAEAMSPILYACFREDASDSDVNEILTVLSLVVNSVVVLYAQGSMPIKEILPALEMTIRRIAID
jgi:TetR/AcrR family transcriptional regulator, cholesterol catabolism regulator